MTPGGRATGRPILPARRGCRRRIAAMHSSGSDVVAAGACEVGLVVDGYDDDGWLPIRHLDDPLPVGPHIDTFLPGSDVGRALIRKGDERHKVELRRE